MNTRTLSEMVADKMPEMYEIQAWMVYRALKANGMKCQRGCFYVGGPECIEAKHSSAAGGSASMQWSRWIQSRACALLRKEVGA